MGFFSKIWKGTKKTFKKIGKGIKKGFAKFGKFMGKIGILGSIALTLLTGGLGIGAAFSGFGATLATSSSAILRGAGWVIGKAAQFGNVVKSGFKTLTKGVTEFFGQTAKYVGSKLGMNIQGAPTSFLGEGGVWQNTSKAVTDQFSKFTGDVGKLASKSAYDPIAAIKIPTPTSDDLIKQTGEMSTPSADTSAFMDAPPSLDASKVSIDPTSISDEVGGALGEYDPKTGGFAYKGQTLQATASVPTGTVVPDLTSEIPGSSFADAGAEVLNVDKGSLLGRAYSSAKDNLFEGVTKAPGAVVTNLIVNKAMGAGEEEPYFGNTRVADFDSSYGIAGAVQQGLTQTQDPAFSQQLFDYDAYGNNQGGYSNVYANRMKGV